VTIFEHIQDPKYLRYCLSLTKCEQSAYDLYMNAALEIQERGYSMQYPYTLFCKVARNMFLNEKKPVPLDIDVPEMETLEEFDFGQIIELANQPPRSKRQFVTNEIFKLYLKLKTEKAVSEYTGINRNTIHSQINKFKNYARKNLNLD
jgi:DNA-directed RNA polymerase specialized sigma24 family protein